MMTGLQDGICICGSDVALEHTEGVWDALASPLLLPLQSPQNLSWELQAAEMSPCCDTAQGSGRTASGLGLAQNSKIYQCLMHSTLKCRQRSNH